MRVLVACEFSGRVRDAFRKQGHDAWSCDLVASDSPFHIRYDVLQIYKDGTWDMMIAHPPCDDLAVSGSRWFKEKIADGRQAKSIEFFMELAFAWRYIPKICIENPIGIMSSRYRKPDQIIQPWMFGHGETKSTCLWLKGLPLLKPTNIVEGRKPVCHYESPGIKNGLTRAQRRSITYQGIADGMASQWGNK